MVTFLLGLKFGNVLGNLHDWKFWKATHSCGNFLKILVYFQSENLSVNYSIHQIDQGIRLYTIIQSKTNWIPEISLNWVKHSSPEMNRESFFFCLTNEIRYYWLKWTNPELPHFKRLYSGKWKEGTKYEAH